MMGAQWPIETHSVDQIVLDPNNVRVRDGRGDELPGTVHAVSEEVIAKYMLAAEDLLSLVQDILRDGYLDNEIPVVVCEGDDVVVLEGNRRLTALKVIADPSLLGTESSQVERWIDRYPEHDTPRSIRVMFAPSRDDAQPLLARLHTTTPKKSWLREQQAIFYHAQVSDGASVEELKVRYPTAKNIPRFMQMAEMREVIRSLDFGGDEAVREFVLDSKLRMSSFEYVYRNKKLAAALGLSFTRDGFLEDRTISKGQQAALLYLIGRLRDRSLTTRSDELKAKNAACEELAEKVAALVAGTLVVTEHGDPQGPSGGEKSGWIPELASNNPAGSRSNEPSASPSAGDGSEATPGPSTTGDSRPTERGPNRGDTRVRLNMDGFVYAGTSRGLGRRYEELRKINVSDYPNATHDLLRTILECSIKEMRREEGVVEQRRVPTLGPLIDWLLQHYQDEKNGRMVGLVTRLKKTGKMNSGQLLESSDSLNFTNHEPDFFMTPQEVHAAWDHLKPILREIVGQESPAAGR
ncbi:hypothetical protein GCM10020260_00490 [Nesterenkonia halobia]|uniref:ParB/Sulfiredoxin domain-containing protein n=2 Tax=Nesterenkonia halobia TaxID=37922 RepID=A0ABP6R5U0_9MICC